MTKVYTLAHPKNRWHIDFIGSGTWKTKPSCEICNRNLNELAPPLLYEWEEEFGTPHLSKANSHDFFWGESEMTITHHGRLALDRMDLPMEYLPAKPITSELRGNELVIRDLPASDDEYLWARPTIVAEANAEKSNNRVCDQCGGFADKVRQSTRLRIIPSAETAVGLFTIRQNRGGPIFVTEEIKNAFEVAV